MYVHACDKLKIDKKNRRIEWYTMKNIENIMGIADWNWIRNTIEFSHFNKIWIELFSIFFQYRVGTPAFISIRESLKTWQKICSYIAKATSNSAIKYSYNIIIVSSKYIGQYRIHIEMHINSSESVLFQNKQLNSYCTLCTLLDGRY